MYTEAMKAGYITEDYWLNYAKNPQYRFMPPQIIEDAAPLARLVQYRDEAIKRFYFRPQYIFREIGRLSTIGEFLRKFRMAKRLAYSVYVK
jgi:hypothetical protein